VKLSSWVLTRDQHQLHGIFASSRRQLDSLFSNILTDITTDPSEYSFGRKPLRSVKTDVPLGRYRDVFLLHCKRAVHVTILYGAPKNFEQYRGFEFGSLAILRDFIDPLLRFRVRCGGSPESCRSLHHEHKVFRILDERENGFSVEEWPA
jgi:hypothetical protein